MVVLALLGILGGLVATGIGGYRANMKDYTAERMLDVLEEAYLYARTITKTDAVAVTAVPDLVLGEELGGTYLVEPKGKTYTITYTTDKGTAEQKTYIRNGDQNSPPEVPTVDAVYEEVLKMTGNVRRDMQIILEDIKGMSLKEKKEYFKKNGYEIPNNNVSNDTFRAYLFQVVYKGTWPKLPDEFFMKNGLEVPKQSLYVQPYIASSHKPAEVVVFARTDNSANGGWWTSYVYIEDTWFYNPKGGISVTEPYKSLKKTLTDENSPWVALEGGQLEKPKEEGQP